MNLKTEANRREINRKNKNKARRLPRRKQRINPFQVKIPQPLLNNKPKGLILKGPTTYSLLINLQSTLMALKQSFRVIKSISKKKGLILVVGTRQDYTELLHNYAIETKRPFFSRWSSGNLTNWTVSADSVRKFGKRLDSMKLLDWQRQKLVVEFLRKFGGVLLRGRKPSLVIFLNAQDLSKPINEALSSGIPSMGLMSTGGNPRALTYPIPANDSLQVVGLFLMWVQKAIQDGVDSRNILRSKQALLQASREIKFALEKKVAKKAIVKKVLIKTVKSVHLKIVSKTNK